MCLAHISFDFVIRLFHTDHSLFQHTHFDGMKLLSADLCLRQWILVEHLKVKTMKIITIGVIVNMLFFASELLWLCLSGQLKTVCVNIKSINFVL